MWHSYSKADNSIFGRKAKLKRSRTAVVVPVADLFKWERVLCYRIFELRDQAKKGSSYQIKMVWSACQSSAKLVITTNIKRDVKGSFPTSHKIQQQIVEPRATTCLACLFQSKGRIKYFCVLWSDQCVFNLYDQPPHLQQRRMR